MAHSCRGKGTRAAEATHQHAGLQALASHQVSDNHGYHQVGKDKGSDCYEDQEKYGSRNVVVTGLRRGRGGGRE